MVCDSESDSEVRNDEVETPRGVGARMGDALGFEWNRSEFEVFDPDDDCLLSRDGGVGVGRAGRVKCKGRDESA